MYTITEDRNGHGTHLCGSNVDGNVIVNGNQGMGLAPQAELIVLKKRILHRSLILHIERKRFDCTQTLDQQIGGKRTPRAIQSHSDE